MRTIGQAHTDSALRASCLDLIGDTIGPEVNPVGSGLAVESLFASAMVRKRQERATAPSRWLWDETWTTHPLGVHIKAGVAGRSSRSGQPSPIHRPPRPQPSRGGPRTMARPSTSISRTPEHGPPRPPQRYYGDDGVRRKREDTHDVLGPRRAGLSPGLRRVPARSRYELMSWSTPT